MLITKSLLINKGIKNGGNSEGNAPRKGVMPDDPKDHILLDERRGAMS